MKTAHLISRLPEVRGRLEADAPLAPLCWECYSNERLDLDDLAQSAANLTRERVTSGQSSPLHKAWANVKFSRLA